MRTNQKIKTPYENFGSGCRPKCKFKDLGIGTSGCRDCDQNVKTSRYPNETYVICKLYNSK